MGSAPWIRIMIRGKIRMDKKQTLITDGNDCASLWKSKECQQSSLTLGENKSCKFWHACWSSLNLALTFTAVTRMILFTLTLILPVHEESYPHTHFNLYTYRVRHGGD
jgi:hypothetical protein